jgi:DNA-binding NarL/FixJ family response regulator
MKLRLMLADDHEMYREALGMFLDAQADIEVIAQAENGYDLLERVAEDQPDVACIDIGMHGLDGIETTRRLLALHPGVKVVALSAHVDLSRVAEMVGAGALGYVIKGSLGAQLLAAIRTVSQNRHHLDPALGIKDLAELDPYLRRVAELRRQAGPGAP